MKLGENFKRSKRRTEAPRVRDAGSGGRQGVQEKMGNNRRTEGSKNNPGTLKKFEPGHEMGPIEDRNEYEQRIEALPKDQQELAQESTRLADLCQYFSTQKIDIPSELVERVTGLCKFQIPERIRALREINKALTAYLNDVGRGPGILQ